MTVSRFPNSWFSALDSFNVGPAWPRNRDKLANITPILLWFMILITSQTMYNYRYKGLQPTYNWGGTRRSPFHNYKRLWLTALK